MYMYMYTDTHQTVHMCIHTHTHTHTNILCTCMLICARQTLNAHTPKYMFIRARYMTCVYDMTCSVALMTYMHRDINNKDCRRWNVLETNILPRSVRTLRCQSSQSLGNCGWRLCRWLSDSLVTSGCMCMHQMRRPLRKKQTEKHKQTYF